MTLAAFLLARINEDEAAARGAAGNLSGHWQPMVSPRADDLEGVADAGLWDVGQPGIVWPIDPTVHHQVLTADARADDVEITPDGRLVEGGAIASIVYFAGVHDPARVLAECEAKRRIVELANDVESLEAQIEGEWGVSTDPEHGERPVSDGLLAALALPYAHHHEYDAAWQPDATR